MRPPYTDDEVMEKARSLAAKIGESEQVHFYKQAEVKISKNENVQRLVDEIKRHQKESVNLQHFGKTEAYRANEAVIDRLQKELDAIPIVQEFRQAQEDVNDFLQLLTDLVSRRINDSGQPNHE